MRGTVKGTWETVTMFTVVGYWDDDEPIPTGVIEGEHRVYSRTRNGPHSGRWATVVEADSISGAEFFACKDMLEALARQ